MLGATVERNTLVLQHSTTGEKRRRKPNVTQQFCSRGSRSKRIECVHSLLKETHYLRVSGSGVRMVNMATRDWTEWDEELGQVKQHHNLLSTGEPLGQICAPVVCCL